MSSSAARRVAVRVLVHPDEHLPHGLRGSSNSSAILPGPPPSLAQQTTSAKQALAGFPYYCLPYHPLLCGPGLHHPGVQLPQPPDEKLEAEKL